VRYAAANVILGARSQGCRTAQLGVADQALSSLTNFGVGICVARLLGTSELGAFSLAFVTYFVALNATRGLATDPLLVRYSGVDPASWRRAVRDATGMVIVVGLILGACSLTAGMLLGGSLRLAFVSLGLMLPGLLLQDSWRYSFFAARRGKLAFVNDLVWALTLVPALAIAVTTDHTDFFWLTLAWGGSALVAALVGAVQARLVPRPRGTTRWLREQHDLAFRYLGENLTVSGAYQLRTHGLSAIAGLAAAGSIRTAELLLGPVKMSCPRSVSPSRRGRPDRGRSPSPPTPWALKRCSHCRTVLGWHPSAVAISATRWPSQLRPTMRARRIQSPGVTAGGEPADGALLVGVGRRSGKQQRRHRQWLRGSHPRWTGTDGAFNYTPILRNAAIITTVSKWCDVS
jgi:hypothetical protein